jgi:predicted transcriptional regulator
MKILEYIKRKEEAGEDAYLLQMKKDLNLELDALARELKILIDKRCVLVYEGGLYTLTPEGERELKLLKGEY